jgi:hypothetical protein
MFYRTTYSIVMAGVCLVVAFWAVDRKVSSSNPTAPKELQSSAVGLARSSPIIIIIIIIIAKSLGMVVITVFISGSQKVNGHHKLVHTLIGLIRAWSSSTCSFDLGGQGMVFNYVFISSLATSIIVQITTSQPKLAHHSPD